MDRERILSQPPWRHGNITRSKGEELLSKAARDGSFLIRDSESIQGAFALCVLHQSSVYTYRILPNEDSQLSVQASEGVPIRFYSMLSDLVEAYYSPNMGLVTHLQYPVPREEEVEEESESNPPQLPPRTFSGYDVKQSEQAIKTLPNCFLTRLQQIDLPALPEEQLMAIQDYFRDSMSLDAEQVQNGNPSMPGLKKLIFTMFKNLNSEIARLLPALEVLHRTLDTHQSPGLGSSHRQFFADPGQSVTFTLDQLTKLLYSIEDKAKNFVFDTIGYEGGHRKSLIPTVTFEVKQESLGIATKMFLKVDVESGKLYFKKSKDGPEDKYYVHNKILQLVKSQTMHAKLVVVVETEKEKILRKEFVFDDTKKREGFCQLLQLMKNKHSGKPEPDMITVFIGTWNMGNKGAVGVSFMFNGTSFGFVNSHLTSGSEKRLRRNQNYLSILRFLNLGDKRLIPFDIAHRFTHLFWFGDLNYRIDLPSTDAELIVSKIKQQQYQDLLVKDQLSIERQEGRVFVHFSEEEITFAPTYRFERYSREKYAYTKAKATGTKYNLPSWCDRVLRKSYPDVYVLCQAYGCTNDIMTSDHSPVFASFELGVASQFVSKKDPNSQPQGGIQIMNCMANLLTKSKTRFFIEFYSSCLEKRVKTSEGENREHSDGTIKVVFGTTVKLTPIISDAEYLLDQHILICVKSTDCDESYGEGCIALRSAELCYKEFDIPLTHHGEKTGFLTGGIQLTTSERKPSEKLYDFIKIERDESVTLKGKICEPNKGSPDQVLDISNPSYMGLPYKGAPNKSWSYTAAAKPDSAVGSMSSSPVFDKEKASEMFDNPLYASMARSYSQDFAQVAQPPPVESNMAARPADGEYDRRPVPNPRQRSFTCSENKPPSVNTVQSTLITKKPVVPSRSEGGMGPSRPPLPAKFKPAPPDHENPKMRDYRDTSEIPTKPRPQARSSQLQPQKDAHHDLPRIGRSTK
ncbi:phosphatidylinositol 3,4,5-trisphosphate 5-phosphatase 1 isoform X2 [Synchiropus splendidus]|uniref:phosphatidylinositol 3,4,5-trisphosphate 5-phosphatase 1 isoform X2 n=1 Tax=Synchiropus splendidus TaxID=270530 RepID=UPI00237D5AEF|nr:phosphatidylinositol 3,4,5-trisphosphate 5-phosphatase 1 isoform X2 [Synchiropus splendidus]